MPDDSRKRSYGDDHVSTDPATSFTNSDKIKTLQSLLGDHIPEQRLIQLLTQCKGDLELAANMYFATADKPNRAPVQPSHVEQPPDMSYIGDMVVPGKWHTSEPSS